jgi:subtilisin family serine protease
MMTRTRCLAAIAAAVLWVVPVSAQPAPGPASAPEIVPDQFIVELNPAIGPDAVIRDHGLVPVFKYGIIRGFAAKMPRGLARRVAADPRVHAVSPDLVVRTFVRPGRSRRTRVSGPASDISQCRVSPDDKPVFDPEVQIGVRRIGADMAWARGNTGAGVKVAVIDTGIDPCHPDLVENLKGGVNLVRRRRPPTDDNGHGTHVAGIIGAALNGFGVAGVAPEASLYAVKVLDAEGAGTLSTVIRGLEWAARNGMDVANMSFGTLDPFGGRGPLCSAIASATAAGMTVVAAAGNEQIDASLITPANCRDSLTVTGFVDTDGRPGGDGPEVMLAPGLVERDDTFAETFSNFSNACWDTDGDDECTSADSPVVDLMAPAVGVRSTLPTYPAALNDLGVSRNYDFLTGTSMAAPHVAGAAALFIAANPGATPARVRLGLTTGGECEAGGTGGSPLCPEPWTDDPDFDPEPLVSVDGF